MNNLKIQKKQEKIELIKKGLEKSYQKMIEEKRKKNQKIVIYKDDKIITILP